MNDITVAVYLVLFASVVGATFAFMWKMMGSTLAEFDKRPVNSRDRDWETVFELELV